MPMSSFRIYPISESAVTLQFGDLIDLESHQKVLQYQQAIQLSNMPGFVECVPAYASLSVYFDLLTVSASDLLGETPFEKVSKFIQLLKTEPVGKHVSHETIEIPVCYDEEFGLDLSDLARQLEISSEEVIKLHTGKTYIVYMIGFTPGFPYMGEVDAKLACSRKLSPRIKVPAGSVAIAGKQTGIYPYDTPGGWQILGRTPHSLFSTHSNPPALLQAGMRVKFRSVTRDEFHDLTTR